jgi:serine/threonine protein kinase
MSTKNILVLEYANQGSLLLYLQTRKPSYSLKKQLFRQIVSAITYLHSHYLAHRDLKL